jgi:hypothetical protein
MVFLTPHEYNVNLHSCLTTVADKKGQVSQLRSRIMIRNKNEFFTKILNFATVEFFTALWLRSPFF